MLDTVRFIVPVSQELKLALQSSGVRHAKYTSDKKTIIFNHTQADIHIPTFSRVVSVSVSDLTDCATLEFSVPKLLLGHNVCLITEQQVLRALRELETALKSTYGQFPPFQTWRVSRLDICYAWKLESNAIAQTCINELKRLVRGAYSNKLSSYETSFHIRGRTLGQKMYLKHPELLKHDYKTLSDKDPDNAKKILDLSTGVLRFEVTLRQNRVWALFGSHATITDILKQDIYKILDVYFQKLIINIDKKDMKQEKVFKQLQQKYSKTKAIQLFQFYIAYCDFTTRQYLMESYTRQAVWKNLKALRDAEVGLPVHILQNLTIPSGLAPHTV